jgi:hypothetical protein
MDIPHKCSVWEFCYLNDDQNYKILFCTFCRRVVGYEKDGKRFMRTFDESKYGKKEYSQETLNDSV